jgi:hypothetical protein
MGKIPESTGLLQVFVKQMTGAPEKIETTQGH